MERPSFADVAPARRRNMAAIQSKNTKPEVGVRRLLHALGYRFRLHIEDLPGRPDIAFSARRKAIFIHGCFWHRHGCRNSILPKSRTEWWDAKLTRNVERDAAVQASLHAIGWSTMVVWECECRDGPALSSRLGQFLGAPGKPAERRAKQDDLAPPSRDAGPGEG